MKISIRQPLGYSHIGRKDNQEDNVYPLFERVDDQQRFFILCDGVGGQDHGEVASRCVCDTVGAYLEQRYTETGDVTEDDITLAIEKAYDALDTLDKDDQSKMATTFTCVCLTGNGAIVAHMGDSRIYQVRPGQGVMYQSADHSLVNALLAAGELTPEEAKDFPRKNVITRALQPHSERRFNAEIHTLTDVRSGDYFFLCCDGVLEQLTNDRLVEILSAKRNDNEKVRLLEQEGLDKTKDNFTAYLIPIDKVEGAEGADVNEELAVEVSSVGNTNRQPMPQQKLPLPSKGHKKFWVAAAVITFVAIAVIAFLVTPSKKKSQTPIPVAQNEQKTDLGLDSILSRYVKEFEASAGCIAIWDVDSDKIVDFAAKGYKKNGETALDELNPTGLLSTFIIEECLNTGKVSPKDTIDTGNGMMVIKGDTLLDQGYSRGGYGVLSLEDAYFLKSRVAQAIVVEKSFGSAKLLNALLKKKYDVSPVEGQHYAYEASPRQVLNLYASLLKRKSSKIWGVLDYDRNESKGANELKDFKANWGKMDVVDVEGVHYMDICGFVPYDHPQYVVYIGLKKKGLPASGMFAAKVFMNVAEKLKPSNQ